MRISFYILIIIVFFANCSEEKLPTSKLDQAIAQYLPDSVENYQDFITANYQVFAMPLPKNLNFAGDRIPMENLFVRENLDREILVNTYWHSNTFLYQKRAARWFPTIEKILAENNMPDDLKYLALVESGLDNVQSPAGAAGFWQFMAATGREYGMEINQFVDERYNLEKATHAACKYLKKAYKQFGSWSLAAASYNMGKGGLNNQLTKQKVNSYWDLYLNKETSRYVYRILAAKLILSNSENFGFSMRDIDYYRPYNTYSISIDSTISDLPQFALDQGTNYATMRHLNPWLRGFELPNNQAKIYQIKLPRGDFHIESVEIEQDSLLEEENTEELDSTEFIPLVDSLKIDSTEKIIKDTLKKLVKANGEPN